MTVVFSLFCWSLDSLPWVCLPPLIPCHDVVHVSDDLEDSLAFHFSYGFLYTLSTYPFGLNKMHFRRNVVLQPIEIPDNAGIKLGKACFSNKYKMKLHHENPRKGKRMKAEG